jgi:hypothetical protein
MAALKYLGQTCLKERETERGRQVHSQEDLICGKNAKKVCQQSTFRSVLNKTAASNKFGASASPSRV